MTLGWIPRSEESFLTVAEVAELLKLNQQTVRNWIDQGTLPALKVGRRVRIKRSDLERMLEEGYRDGGTPRHPSGPSAQDFWSGEPVGVAEVDPAAEVSERPQDEDDSPGIAPLSTRSERT